MIEERALVTSRDGEFANIETRRTTACGHCQVKSACSTSLLSKYFGYRNLSVRALNPIDACPGDEVIVGLHESALTAASVSFYLLPILLLIGFAVFAQWLAEELNFVATEPASLLGGLLGLSTGLAWARHNALRRSRDNRYQAVILRPVNQLEVRQ
ncbi:MAG: SoxR reducing system RseC family protein [Gammaproteobacteria bacterium]|nr:SoxR reducing system RseC family protein [Gammaproteobacteria bacterium]MCB1878429.1 SoxR reducing system RseC family protein [Gammaproteobacteria bacterium]MCB1904292.1 SoxR reducing system RseC family protein [Gammaproteobacteria bacterium]